MLPQRKQSNMTTTEKIKKSLAFLWAVFAVLTVTVAVAGVVATIIAATDCTLTTMFFYNIEIISDYILIMAYNIAT